MEEAVYSDCRLLIKNFADKARPSFKSFCAEWKKLNFQHIFTNQTTYIQTQQTTACAFHFGKRILCNRSVTRDQRYNFAADTAKTAADDETKLLQRIGALFLLYAIYFKQPLKQYTKIEVCLEMWHEMKNFVKIILPANRLEYDEARFVFWKLFQVQAFRFTALDYCVGLEGLVDYYDLENTKSFSLTQDGEGVGKAIEKHTNFTKISQTTPALVALEKGYNEMKSELTKMHKLDAKLLPTTNIFQTIRESFQKIEMIIDEADEKNDDDADEGDETAATTSFASKRRKLKNKAYSRIKVVRKIISKEEKPSEAEQPQQQESKNVRICRMSARTIFQSKLPEHVDEIHAEHATTSNSSDDSNEASTSKSKATLKKIKQTKKTLKEKENKKNAEPATIATPLSTSDSDAECTNMCQQIFDDLK